jgi:hypothetical protein
MTQTHLRSLAVGLVLAGGTISCAAPAHAQNDWQYPDPYFGILEIEKSHTAATAGRYRAEVNPAARTSRGTPPSAVPTAPGEPAKAAAAAPSPAPRPRWRNRWRR